jgi:DNA-binding NtrC family response regulator
VLHADSPQAALDLLETLGNPAVDLLVSDVVMPGMSGPQLYAELRARLPALRVLFMSGHPRDILKRAPERWGGANYLGKPFSVYRLASQVRRVLEDPVVQDAS